MQVSYTVNDLLHGKRLTQLIFEVCGGAVAFLAILSILCVILSENEPALWCSVVILCLISILLPFFCINVGDLNEEDNSENIKESMAIIEKAYGVMFGYEAREEFIDSLVDEQLFDFPKSFGGAWITLDNSKMLFINLLWTVKGKYRMNEPTELDIEFYIEDCVLYDVQYRKLVPGKNTEEQLVEAGCAKPVIPLKVSDALYSTSADGMGGETIEELEVRENNENTN